MTRAEIMDWFPVRMPRPLAAIRFVSPPRWLPLDVIEKKRISAHATGKSAIT